MSGQPKRGYSWEPFAVDNEAAVTHGAHSERRWRPLAESLLDLARQDAPWLARPAFRWSAEAWATAEAKAHLIDAWLEEQATEELPGALDDGGVRSAALFAERLHARAESLRSRLALDLTSFSRIFATFAAVPGGEDALELLKAEGRRLVQAREASLSPVNTPADPEEAS